MKASMSKNTSPSKAQKTPRKKRAPRGSLLGSGGGSKSNLWTTEQRRDLFSRRQNGEDWETICPDFPNRTRHAMQQQYSLQKGENTDPIVLKPTARRGGRKPRAAANRGHNWTSINKNPFSDEEDNYEDYGAIPMELEIGDDDDTEYEDVSQAAAEESSQHADEEIVPKSARSRPAPRPSALARSATEPVKPAPKGSKKDKAVFPNLPPSATLPPPDFGFPAKAQPETRKESPKSPKKTQKEPSTTDQVPSTKRKSSAVEVSETESRASSRQSKRAKYSTEPSEAPAPGASASEPTPSLPPKSPYPALVLPPMILNMDEIMRAQERAKEFAATYEAERTSRKDASEAAQKRATRRANDAEQKLLEAGQEFAMKIKVEKALIATELATMKEERDSARTQLDAMTAERDACTKENQMLKEAAASFTGNASLRQQLATQESQLKLYDQLRSSITTEAQKPLELSTRLKQESNEHNIQQSLLTTSINKFTDEFEDLSNKMIVKSVKEIQQQNQELVKQKSVELEACGKMMEALEAFIAPFTADVPGLDEQSTTDGAASAGAENFHTAASASEQTDPR